MKTLLNQGITLNPQRFIIMNYELCIMHFLRGFCMRLFIAICFPEAVKRQLAEYAGRIGALARRANITREDNFHLTLAFLGDALTDIEACTALNAVNGAAFKLYSDKPGSFARGSGAIHWLGLKSSAELTELHKRLNAALSAEGYKPENRPFNAHITLAREVRGLMAEELPPPPRFIVPVRGLTLMNSERIDGLLTYRPIYEKSF